MKKNLIYSAIGILVILTLALLIYNFGYSTNKKLYNFPRNSYGDNGGYGVPKAQQSNGRQ